MGKKDRLGLRLNSIARFATRDPSREDQRHESALNLLDAPCLARLRRLTQLRVESQSKPFAKIGAAINMRL